MDSLFLDTNVLLDVIVEREPFVEDSLKVWKLVESGQMEGWISAISFNNIFYIVRKLKGADTAYLAMETLNKIFRTAALDQLIVEDALALKIPDFEDAIQYASASHSGCHWLLSRNAADFPSIGKPIVLKPENFLK